MLNMISLLYLYLLSHLLFSCGHHSAKQYPPQKTFDTLTIDQIVKEQDRSGYARLSDTTKGKIMRGRDADYYSVTNYYYDPTTKELLKIESILQAISRSIFVSYYHDGTLLKTTASTDMGMFTYYFSGEQANNMNGLKKQCFNLALEGMEKFNKRIGK